MINKIIEVRKARNNKVYSISPTYSTVEKKQTEMTEEYSEEVSNENLITKVA